MHIEMLESRRLMSVAASHALGTLYVYGDDNQNIFRIERSGADIVVKNAFTLSGYTEIYRVSDAKIHSLIVTARGGNDKVEVDFGVDADVTINGGHGGDWLKAGGNNCHIYGDYDPAKATQTDDNAPDTLICGCSGVGIYYGQGGNDTFHSGMAGIGLPLYGKEYFRGGNGNDTFYTGFGNSGRLVEVKGEAGNDTLHGGPHRTVDFYGGSGADTVDFSDYGQAVYLLMNGTRVSGSFYPASDRGYLINYDVENATGTQYADHIGANSADNVLRGGKGNDSIFGLAGSDHIYGGDGDDSIEGGIHDDYCYGEAGNDYLDAVYGIDLLNGGSGNDKFKAGDGSKDYIVGGSGTDTVLSKDNVDLLYEIP